MEETNMPKETTEEKIRKIARQEAEETQEEKIKKVAKEAAKELLDVATVAASTLATATSLDISYIKKDINEIKVMLDNKYVLLSDFKPIKQLVYGFVGMMLIAVVGAIIALVIKK